MKGNKDSHGLKDHEIQGLINSITAQCNLWLVGTAPQSMREIVASGTIKYLEENNLRIDK